MTLRDLPARVHRSIENLEWGRPAVDLVARSWRRGTMPALLDRQRPAHRTTLARASVSVIIPCYNYGRFLDESVGSALSQVGADIEVIVVDDCSTDGSALKMYELAKSDPRVIAVSNPRNLGHVHTFNRGYAEATGDFIIRLDADDLLTPGSVGRALQLFEENPNVGLVYGHPRHFTTAAPPRPRIGDPTWSVWAGHQWIRERCRRGYNCITTPEGIIRASVLRQVGPLNTTLRFAQDMEMWLRVASVSDVGRINDVDQAFHRDHDASMSVNEGAGLLTDLVERRLVFTEMFRTQKAEFEDVDDLEALFRKTLAEQSLGHAAHFLDRRGAGTALVPELVDFAADTYPEAETLPAWDRVLRRTGASRGPGLRHARVVGARVRDELDFLRWTRTGL